MPLTKSQRIHLGAEAEVWGGDWMGKDAVVKIRKPRSWRHPDLEKRLGFRRMQSEVRLLIRLHNEGIPVPKIWDVDLENGIIVMEKIQGKPLIEVLRDDSISQDFIENALISCGCAVRKLHRRAITHGDLSTNNILIDTNANASLIDFGLAAVDYEVERFGIDLHVMDEILGASHPNIGDAMVHFVAGYEQCEQEMGPPSELSGGVPPTAKQVLNRLDEVRSRVRYHG